MLIERPRRGADAAGRGLTREGAAIARRRTERAEAVTRLAARLERAHADGVEGRRSRLIALWRHAGAVSYRGVLARGFALVRDEADRALRRAADVREGQRLTIEFADGAVPAVAGRESPPEPRSPPGRPVAAAAETRRRRQGRRRTGFAVLSVAGVQGCYCASESIAASAARAHSMSWV